MVVFWERIIKFLIYEDKIVTTLFKLFSTCIQNEASILNRYFEVKMS